MFIVIEGIEGSGKTTLLEGLAQRLHRDGRKTLVTREPGGTPLGDAIRTLFLARTLAIEPLTEVLLVTASRAQHVHDVVRPALAAGKIVLCDRFNDSTLAYQGYGRGVDLALIRSISEIATGGLKPDLVLLIDMPVDAARMRLQEREEDADRIEQESKSFHERVQRGYLELAKLPDHRVLDGTLSPERLLEQASSAVTERLRATTS